MCIVQVGQIMELTKQTLLDSGYCCRSQLRKLQGNIPYNLKWYETKENYF